MINIDKPLVSVVIPTYNHAQYLGRALQSVFDQTYNNWEAIVVDNHSTDNTDEILSNFIDPRIVVLKVNNNGIIAVSRNAGINVAKGEWIAFLDSDDWWTKDKLEICLQYPNNQNDIIYHDLEIISDQPRYFRPKLIKSWQTKKPVTIDLLTRGNALATSSVTVRKRLLEQVNGMNENRAMVGSEDYNTWLHIANLTEKFKYVPKKLGFYQLHKNGISQKNMFYPMTHATSEFLYLLNTKQKNKNLANLNYTKGRFEYLAGNHIEANKRLFFSTKHGRLDLKIKGILMLISSLFTSK
ncbi:glycosyltransferase [Thiothrix litoralis]|uniref:Glycosyltransferase n=1 Tax=Thiothrix litoralis TaxID=2891210 RepID=A0ABX7WZT7_9GAMM|nr:glycosyltransferase [Thiothrix litoralis]QTR46425.1 glycosyltransferase [Thiothrix litoralis]